MRKHRRPQARCEFNIGGISVAKVPGDFAIEMHRNIIIRCNFGNAAARELRTDP